MRQRRSPLTRWKRTKGSEAVAEKAGSFTPRRGGVAERFAAVGGAVGARTGTYGCAPSAPTLHAWQRRQGARRDCRSAAGTALAVSLPCVGRAARRHCLCLRRPHRPRAARLTPCDRRGDDSPSNGTCRTRCSGDTVPDRAAAGSGLARGATLCEGRTTAKRWRKPRSAANPTPKKKTTPIAATWCQSRQLATIGEILPQWSGAGSNRRHTDFQSVALPTELPDRTGNCVHKSTSSLQEREGGTQKPRPFPGSSGGHRVS